MNVTIGKRFKELYPNGSEYRLYVDRDCIILFLFNGEIQYNEAFNHEWDRFDPIVGNGLRAALYDNPKN